MVYPQAKFNRVAFHRFENLSSLTTCSSDGWDVSKENGPLTDVSMAYSLQRSPVLHSMNMFLLAMGLHSTGLGVDGWDGGEKILYCRGGHRETEDSAE